MCEECRMSNCPCGCPNYEPNVAFQCDECGGDICAGETYYEFEDLNICEDCLYDYASAFKREAPEYEPDYDDGDD